MQTKEDYKMMVLDLDGTLLNSSGRLEADTKSILQNCMRSGKKIVLCSSRSYDELRRIAEELYQGCGEQYCICLGGACCYTWDGKGIIKADPIPAASTKRMITLAESRRIHIHGYDGEFLYYYRETRAFGIFVEFAGIADIPMKKISGEDFLRKKYLKLMCLGEREELERYNAEVSHLAYTAFSNPANQQGYLDMIPLGVSKGTGVKQLCRYLGVPLGQCICVGDGENDIPMLRAAGLGVAMKNGRDSVRAAADYITPYSNDENAIGHLAEHFML